MIAKCPRPVPFTLPALVSSTADNPQVLNSLITTVTRLSDEQDFPTIVLFEEGVVQQILRTSKSIFEKLMAMFVYNDDVLQVFFKHSQSDAPHFVEIMTSVLSAEEDKSTIFSSSKLRKLKLALRRSELAYTSVDEHVARMIHRPTDGTLMIKNTLHVLHRVCSH